MRFTEDVCWSRLLENNGSDIVFMNDIINKDVNWKELFINKEINSEYYGVEWDYSSPSPKLIRTGDAKGFAAPVPATSLTGTGSSPFDRIMPWAGMRMCNIINGEVVYWQEDPQFSESAYDTMVYIPPFWYKAEKDTANSKWRWSISPTEREGYARHPGSGRYVGRFHSSLSGSVLYSKSGKNLATKITKTSTRSYSHNKGKRWWMIDIATWSAIQLLYLVEFSDFDSQSMIGKGANGEALFISGGTDGAVYHTLKRSEQSNQYRWIENPFSNARTWVDGFGANNYATYIGTDNSAFGSGTSGLTPTGITLPNSGVISGFGYSEICPWAFIPDDASGGENENVTDSVQRASGVQALNVGGSFYVNSNSGIFFFHVGQPESHTNSALGSRLIFIH